MQQTSPDSAQRFHHLDAARALFMLLGIPFHASLAFAGGHWLVMSGSSDPFLAAIPPILSDFRMPGFFLIACFFAAMLLERRARGDWLKNRAERLGVPLLFGLAAIVPLQQAIVAAAPDGIVDRAAAADPLSHLWFLPTLLLLCLLLAAVWPLVVRSKAIPAPRIVTLAVLLAFYELGLFVVEHLLKSDLNFAAGFLNLGAWLTFLPFFAIGVVLKRSPALWQRFATFDPAVAMLGLVALTMHVFLWSDTSRIGLVLDIMVDGISSLCLTQTILALLMRFVTKGSQTIDRLVDASFTIYLLHHPVVIALAIASIAMQVPALVAWPLICMAALALPYAVHRVLRRSPLALWLMNGVRPDARRGLLVQSTT